MRNALKAVIENAIREATREAFTITDTSGTGGGCINETHLIGEGKRRFFMKLNTERAHAMFSAEAAALEAIRRTDTIRAPRPITWGKSDGHAFLVLEAIEFGRGTAGSWRKMGQQLAALHRHTNAHYGWHRNNTIGSTPQDNSTSPDWVVFFREQRLRPQLELACRNGYRFKLADALLDAVETLLDGHHPKASLLHGDLWSGNAGFSVDGEPLIYDPASYYGDRETDLAFSEFFGGFPQDFYQGYQSAWPLPVGYSQRKELYNLYHVLNHANLFGGGYARQAESMIGRLLE